MERGTLKWITWVFAVLIAVVAALMAAGTLRRPGSITLPDPNTAPDPGGSGLSGGGALTVVEVTPETVREAVATLARPVTYRRTVTVEQFWSGGSTSYEANVAVSGPWTRTDRTMPDGRIRHVITGPESVCVWYNAEDNVYTGPVGEITADHEQPIPTYERVLELEEILAADYREASGVTCIYVEAREGEYVTRYWISVETGLLTAAEKLLDGETVYRMASLALSQAEVTAEDFTLPDGRVLAEP